MIIKYSPAACNLILCLTLLSNVLELRIGKKLDRENRLIRERTNELNNLMYDSLANYVPFKTRNLQEMNFAAFADAQDRIKEANYVWMFSHIRLILLKTFKTDFLQKAVIYLSSACGVLSGSFSIGSSVLLLHYFSSLSAHLSTIIAEAVEFRSNQNSYNRCIALLEKTADERRQRVGHFKSLRIEELHYAYPEQPEILTGLNLQIDASAKVAVSGESGQGKSTLVKCLAGLVRPSEGRILINQIPIEEAEDYYRICTFVMQDAALFDLSLRENLVLGNENIGQERLQNVCEKVGILADIQMLPEGFESQAGAGGTKLSGGQRQKLLLARALLRNSEVLILDEANSALDVKGEADINRCLLACAEKTVLVISHRDTTLDLFPQKYVLRNGKTECFGN